MEKITLIAEVFCLIYIIAWAVVSKLHVVYAWGKWILIKCFVAVTSVPVFILVAGIFIPVFKPLAQACVYIAVMGNVLACVLYFYLPGPSMKE